MNGDGLEVETLPGRKFPRWCAIWLHREMAYKPSVEATDLLGKPFAATDLIRVGFANFFHRPIKKERNPDQALFCSEYVAHCFFAAGAPLAEGTNHHAVTPDQVSKSAMHENKGPIHWDPEDREAALRLGIDSTD